MQREEAIRKVKALVAVATDERAPEGERKAAESLAVTLRLRHGIGDADLVVTESFNLFGHDVFWHRNNITPLLDQIKAAIDKAKERLDKLEPRQRSAEYCRLYKEVREIVEGSSYVRTSLKAARDAAVKAYYEQERDSYDEISKEWRTEPETEVNRLFGIQSVHRHARDYTAIHTELRKDTIERIVGVYEDKIAHSIAKLLQEEG